MKAQTQNNEILPMGPPETSLPHFYKARNLQKLQTFVTGPCWSPQHRAVRWMVGRKLFLSQQSARQEGQPCCAPFPSLLWYKKISPFQWGNKSCTLKTLLFQTSVHQQWNTHLHNLEACERLTPILFTPTVNITSCCYRKLRAPETLQFSCAAS